MALRALLVGDVGDERVTEDLDGTVQLLDREVMGGACTRVDEGVLLPSVPKLRALQ